MQPDTLDPLVWSQEKDDPDTVCRGLAPSLYAVELAAYLQGLEGGLEGLSTKRLPFPEKDDAPGCTFELLRSHVGS